MVLFPVIGYTGVAKRAHKYGRKQNFMYKYRGLVLSIFLIYIIPTIDGQKRSTGEVLIHNRRTVEGSREREAISPTTIISGSIVQNVHWINQNKKTALKRNP
jgi:hypothetical protein